MDGRKFGQRTTATHRKCKISAARESLNIANEFARLKQRHTDKLQLIDWEEFDAECKELYETLKWRYGDGPQPGWA
jgi:hypothetical protein